jgi:hypothetical protein
VINIGTANAAILNFTIPAGAAGLNGATPTGIDHSVNGFIVDNGLIQQLPSWWPPIHTFNPTSSTNNGVSVVFTKDSLGNVAAVIDASTLQATFAAGQATQDSTVTALTATVATLQTDLTALTTAHNTLKARVDAAGIP